MCYIYNTYVNAVLYVLYITRVLKIASLVPIAKPDHTMKLRL